jgi:hypothetical protein
MSVVYPFKTFSKRVSLSVFLILMLYGTLRKPEVQQPDKRGI